MGAQQGEAETSAGSTKYRTKPSCLVKVLPTPSSNDTPTWKRGMTHSACVDSLSYS